MKFGKKLAVIALAVTLAASMMTGCGSSGINGKKTVTTVNGETLTLGTLAFLVKYQQASVTTMFSSMMSQLGSLYDTVSDEETGETYGTGLVKDSLTNLEKFMVISQHADEYGVALTDEDTAKFNEIAQAYMDENDKATRAKIGASKEDVVKLLSLLTINNRMLDPMAADVDTEVPDEECVQTKLTLVSVNVSEELDAEAAKAEAQAVLDAYLDGDEGNDILENAKDIAEHATVANPNFTTADPSDSTLNQAVMDAVADLNDNEAADHVIEADDGSAYYVARVDTRNDEETTKIKKRDIIVQRKNENRDGIVEGWVAESTITRDEKVLANLTVTDTDPIMLAMDEEE